MAYLDLNYKPRKDDIIVLFNVEPAQDVRLEKAAEDIAAESSIGTWTDVKTLTPAIRRRLQAHVFEICGERVKVAYPLDLFELGNMPQFLSSVAGNIFGMKSLANLRLLDFSLPKEYVGGFRGPSFGISGIRRLLKIRNRPLVGTIIKPKVGLPERGHAKVAYEAWAGGCDIVKDDENLTSQRFNKFKDRVKVTLRMRDKAEAETGEKKIYMPNVTAETKEMISRAKYVKSLGGEYVMVDVLTVGFSGLQTLKQENLGMVLHAHRAMHAALTRNSKHGITMLALAKIYRLIGLDQLHIGTVVGKMEGSYGDVTSVKDEITLTNVPESDKHLKQEWFNIKPVFPVCSGGLHQGHVPDLMNILGKDIIIQAGGGVHGHPDGTRAGATGMRQAVDAMIERVPLREYAVKHAELRKALEKFKVFTRP